MLLVTLNLRPNCRSALEWGSPYSKFSFGEVYHRIYVQKSRFTAPLAHCRKTKFPTVYLTIYLRKWNFWIQLSPNLIHENIITLQHEKTKQWGCAKREDLDQPRHQLSLIRVLAHCMKKAWVLSYALSTQQRLWIEWKNAQTDSGFPQKFKNAIPWFFHDFSCQIKNIISMIV